MGAETFYHTAPGKTAHKAFASAVKDAAYEFGHRGYTGSIAEKDSYVLVTKEVFANRDAAMDYADKLIDECDERIDDKWGPAGCVQFENPLGEVEYLFFGWASS